MDRITSAINLLGAVIATMDRITVVGIENQSRFVGCAEAVQNASKNLSGYVADMHTNGSEGKDGQEETNG